MLVFVLALTVRALWIATLPPTLTWPDEDEFVTVARHLAAGDGYVSVSYRANPTLPVYLAAVFRVAGESYAAARLGQAVMGALTCVLIAATAARLLGPSVGWLAGALLAMYLPHVYLSGVFYAECLFTLFVALTIYCAVRGIDEPRPAWLAATGVSFALAALTRPIFLVYLPVLDATIVYAARASRARRAGLAAALVVATALAIAPWTLRNWRVLGRPIVVSSGFGTKLWQGNNEGAAGDADDRELSYEQPLWHARIAALPPAERDAVETRYRAVAAEIAARRAATGDSYLATDAVLGPLALEFMRTHPLRTLELFARKLATLFLPFSKTLVENDDTTTVKRALATAAYLPILVLASFGFWWTAGRRRALWTVYGLFASLVGAYALLNTCTRFRLPLDPYLVMFAAAALVELRARRSREVGQQRPGLSADAAHRAAVRDDEPLPDHARARRLEAER